MSENTDLTSLDDSDVEVTEVPKQRQTAVLPELEAPVEEEPPPPVKGREALGGKWFSESVRDTLRAKPDKWFRVHNDLSIGSLSDPRKRFPEFQFRGHHTEDHGKNRGIIFAKYTGGKHRKDFNTDALED